MSELVQRNFILGEQWLYYKLYCGVYMADIILLDKIKPLTESLLKEKLISQWFFIRYTDPEPHLRIRLKLVESQNLGIIIELFRDYILPYMEKNIVWNLQTDTYRRELERYGTNTIGLSEKLFFYDSLLVIRNLANIKDEEIYFLFTIRCIDSFLTTFQYNLSEKLAFSQNYALYFKNEFELEKPSLQSIAKKYRLCRDNMNKVMNSTGVTKKFKYNEKCMMDRNQNISPYVNTILSYSKNNSLQINLDNLLGSYIHMFMNRSFTNNQRFYEMLAYDFLNNYYKSSYFK